MNKPQLVIGNKNFSSWSLRAWLLLRKVKIDFEEITVELFDGGFKKQILTVYPAGKVPVYIDNTIDSSTDNRITIWDSLAIAEYLAESYPSLWPENTADRAHARSISAEMHSGFTVIRNMMPMDYSSTDLSVSLSEELLMEISRVQAIWSGCRQQHGHKGPWLFGTFTIADAMFAPVVSRFYSYEIDCNDDVQQYLKAVLSDEDMTLWSQDSALEVQSVSTD